MRNDGGRLAEGGLVVERFDLALQAASATLGRVALALPIVPKLTQRNALTHAGVVRDEDVGAAAPMALAPSP